MASFPPRATFRPARSLAPALVGLAWGRAERHGFEYTLYGTLSVFAALHAATVRAHGATAPRLTSAELLRFQTQLAADNPRRQAIRLIADNLSAHKTKAVAVWPAAHPRATLHHTPTHISRLTHVEFWFATIELGQIAPSIFTSTIDRRCKLMHSSRLHHKTWGPVQ